MKILFLFMLFLVCFADVKSQIKTYRFEQIENLQKADKKIVLVFIHTEWCRYCEAMLNTTFKNERIISLLNKSFYFISFNAEEKGEINFNGHTFQYKPNGINTGFHELAEQLGTKDNTVSYPTICFLNSQNEIIFQDNQFVNSTDLLAILTRLKTVKP